MNIIRPVDPDSGYDSRQEVCDALIDDYSAGEAMVVVESWKNKVTLISRLVARFPPLIWTRGAVADTCDRLDGMLRGACFLVRPWNNSDVLVIAAFLEDDRALLNLMF